MRIRIVIKYAIAINGTITSLTFAILLIPPISTTATTAARIIEAIITTMEYVPINGISTLSASPLGSKNPVTALVIPLT